MKLSILHKGLLIVSVPLLFEVFFVFVLLSQIDQTGDHIQKELRSHDIIIAVETILKEVAASTTTAVIYNVSRRPDLLERLKESHDEILSSSARLKRLTKDDREERSEAAKLTASARNWIKNHEEVVNSDPQNKLGAFFLVRGNMNNLLLLRSEGSSNSIIEQEKHIQSVEPRLLRESILRIQILLVFGAIVNIAITIFMASYFAKYISSRMENVLTNTFKLGARMELNPPLRGDDEIAELDQALHHTASEIIEFETFKEQLIGVVSHELRTPLTSIQGTLTLLNAGAMGDYPPSMHRSVEEAQVQLSKLINLVNDLLLVERLESGSQIIKPKEIELGELINTTYQKVKEQLPEAASEILISGTPVDTAGDADLLCRTLTTILLLSQMRMKDRRATMIVVHRTLDGIDIVIEDNGEEIAEIESNQLFSKNSEYQSGLDVLALPLAKAIIIAHAGNMEVASGPDATTFTISLPLRRQSDD